MAKLYTFPPKDGSGSGSGPEGPMLEQRVARVEADVSEI